MLELSLRNLATSKGMRSKIKLKDVITKKIQQNEDGEHHHTQKSGSRETADAVVKKAGSNWTEKTRVTDRWKAFEEGYVQISIHDS